MKCEYVDKCETRKWQDGPAFCDKCVKNEDASPSAVWSFYFEKRVEVRR